MPVNETLNATAGYQMCNIMTGAGFKDWSILGQWSLAMFALVLLFFIIVFARKYLGEEMGMAYSIIGAFIGAYIPYLLAITFTCSPKWSLLIGIIGWAAGAFLGGQFLGEGGGGDY